MPVQKRLSATGTASLCQIVSKVTSPEVYSPEQFLLESGVDRGRHLEAIFSLVQSQSAIDGAVLETEAGGETKFGAGVDWRAEAVSAGVGRFVEVGVPPDLLGKGITLNTEVARADIGVLGAFAWLVELAWTEFSWSLAHYRAIWTPISQLSAARDLGEEPD